MDIPEDLREAVVNRECLIFVGAGMSKEAGLPSGDDLAALLSKMLGINATSKLGKLQQVAQDFVNTRSRTELIKVIREEITKKLETANRESFELLGKIPFPPKEIVTPNWDPLLEEAIGKMNYVPIFEDKAVSQYSEAKINLYKTHGDLEYLESATITEEDYRAYKSKHLSISNDLRSHFQRRTLLFIGFSTEDEDFLDIYMDIFQQLGEHM